MATNETAGGRAAGDRKKTYRRPVTLSREKLEALAVVCSPGKSNGLGDCSIVHMS